MSDHPYSEEQQRIIDAPITDTLVSAAAGSGKTTVLVGRIIDEIIKGRLSIDHLLVVTFTKDAAANMEKKIEDAIRNRMNDALANGNRELFDRLSSQLDMLPNAYIQTIDSFCTRVIKEKGYLTAPEEGRDVFAPGNVILDESDLAIILRRAVELALTKMYMSDIEEDSGFIKLTQRFGDGRTDKDLIDSLTDAFNRLRSIPDYVNRVKDYSDLYRANAGNDIIPGFDELLKTVAVRFADYLERLEDLESFCMEHDCLPVQNAKKNGIKLADGTYITVPEAYDLVFDNLKSYVRRVCEVLRSDDTAPEVKYDVIRDAACVDKVMTSKVLKGLSDKHDNIEDSVYDILSVKVGVIAALLDFCKPFITKFTTPQKYGDHAASLKFGDDIKSFFSHDYAYHLRCVKDSAGAISAYAELIRLIDLNYAELKSSVRGCDFADQEYGAYDILAYEEAQEYYRSKFVEIYIDEYQDNSELQDAIISRIARSEGNVFRVGDVKQSIYKFRNADPGLFINRLNDPGRGSIRFLRGNHRSSCEVVDFVNFVFRQVMTQEGAEIEYNEDQELVWSEHTGHSPKPRLVVVNRSAEFLKSGNRERIESDDEEENTSDGQRLNSALCYGVLGEVRRYLNTEGHSCKDIKILTRNGNKGQILADFLNLHGIPTVSDNKSLVFEDMDIQSIINLIIVLGNEYRDEYLMSVMHRNFRFTNFTLDELAQINAFIKTEHSDYMRVNLMSRIRKYCDVAPDSELKTRLEEFTAVLDDLRMSCMISDIDDMVDMIYEETGIRANITSEDNHGVMKLDILKDWLSQTFKRYGTDIGTIASKLEEIKIKISGNIKYEGNAQEENAVRCMSIHGSKGLEAPFVIFAFDDMGERNETSSGITLDKKAGFVVDDYDMDNISLSVSASRIMYNRDRKAAENAEAMRLLYVALTRAEQELSMVTAADFGDNKVTYLNQVATAASRYGGRSFSREYWLGGNKRVGFILMSALFRASCASPLRQIMGEGFPEPEYIEDYDGFEVVTVDNDELEGILADNPCTDVPETEVKADEPMDGGKTDRKTSYGSYSYDRSIKIPFKVAVTGINDWNISTSTHVDLYVRDKEEYIDKLSGKVTAAGKGTIVHLIMQWADPARYRSGLDELISNVRELAEAGVFAGYDTDDVIKVASEFADGICEFAYTPTGDALNKADTDGRAEYEKPVVFALPAYEGASPDDFVLVQGIIDAVYYEDDGAVVIDYKTDNYGDIIESEVIRKANELHSFQIGCYAASLEASGIHVKQKYLYLVRYGLLVEVR